MSVMGFPNGNYRFLAAPGRPFSSGVIADDGFDLVRARFYRPVPLEEGLAAAQRHVEDAGRPVTAIGAFELRIPEPFSREGFDSFNTPYVRRLAEMGLTADPDLPTARTNVAPTVDGVTVPSVYAFTYTLPVRGPGRGAPAFRLSGSAETRRDGSMGDRVRSIIETLGERMAELGVRWQDSTAINLYGATEAPREVEAEMLATFGPAVLHGVSWYPSRPPVQGLHFEMDARAVGTEMVL